jgi:STE24 endopeptidase
MQRAAFLTSFLLCLSAGSATAQPVQPVTAMPSVTTVPAAARPSPNFSAEAATEAYLAQIPAGSRARSDAYFEGGYWLILWDYLVGAVISVALLQFGWSAWIRDRAGRISRNRSLQTFLYWIGFLLLTTVLGAPLTIYEGFIRERQYGLATQTFGPWMGDQGKGLLVDAVLDGVLIVILFAIVRRLSRTWWIWGSAATFVALLFLATIAPVYIQPIFNKVTPLDDPKVTGPILSLARANGIPAKEVYEIDASRQSNRMSANVSGFAGTLRITLNDNLLRRGSPEEIQAIMGHEMGHYVLDHVYKNMMFSLIVIVTVFALLRWSLDWFLRHWGERWRVRGIGDPAILPLAVLLGSTIMFLLTPILNTETRTDEFEADMYGLNASRQPDGFAQAAIHLGEYRKMKPGPVEEWIFFDHPSGYNRIYAAMRWKAENLALFPRQ